MSGVETMRQDGLAPAALLSVLREQCGLYRRLAGLAQRQRGLITSGETARLLEVLSERQSLLDRVARLADALRPFQQAWPVVRSRLPQEQGEEVDRLVAEIRRLLAGILEADETDAQLLAARKGDTTTAIGTLKRGRDAGMAYAAAATSSTAHHDWSDA